MFKKRHRKLEEKPKKEKLEKGIAAKITVNSSSDEDETHPYTDLISIIGKKEVESDTDSDEEYPVQKRMKKLTSETPAIENEKESDISEISGEDSGSESDVLQEEEEEEDDKTKSEVEIMIFGESDDDDNADTKTGQSSSDFYKLHFEEIISNEKDICKPKLVETLHWKTLGMLKHTRRREQKYPIPTLSMEKNVQSESLRNVYHIRKLLVDNWTGIGNDKLKTSETQGLFSPLQREIFTLFNSYIDVCYNSVTLLENTNDLQAVYCLHAANHVLRARAKVLLNTSRLKQMTMEQREQADYRDQGITRPKVLILLPFKNNALKVINMLLALLHRETKSEIGRKKRFQEEFSKEEEEDDTDYSAFMKKPDDYQALFEGNTDEHFRIGISLLRNSIRLYSPFYSSDIIVASPLGLRTIIGSEKENHYEHDFLSSIEILVMDHTDVFLMQNWEHVLHIMNHINLTPKESHGADFSRVKNYSLDGQNKLYRQTINLSNGTHPQISSLFTKFCFNFKGCFTIENAAESGSICSIAKQLPQVFHKLSPETLVDAADVRFRFFVEQIYRQYKDPSMSHTLVFVPQYFDFVRIRNFMRKEWKDGSGPIFGHINDYSTSAEAGKAKRRFFTGKCPILLYTERFHFYNRTRIRGIRHLIFYELPIYSHFYAELCNMMRDTQSNAGVGSSGSVITLYSKYDARKLAAVVGANRSKELQLSQKNVHMFVTGASSL